MMRPLQWGLTLLATAPLAAQQQNPTNLYVAEIRYQAGGLTLASPHKLTGDRGRNSQPSFTPDGRAIVFNAVRDPSGQGDVYRIDLKTGAETRITNTAENENSPTVLPDGELLLIRWVPATLFREWGLWVYGPDGTPRRGVLPGPDTVGYYVRADDSTFVLVRPTSRFSVAVFDTHTRQTTDLEWPVARLPPQRIPGERAVSFVRTDSSGHHQIRRLELGSRRIETLAPTVAGRTVHTWAGHGLVLMGKGNTVYAIDPARTKEWAPVARFNEPDLQNVSTYVVSPDGSRVILLSTLQPPLHVALQDSLEAGLTAEQAVGRFRDAAARRRYFLSEADLLALGNGRLQTGRASDAMVLLQFSAELLPQSYAAAAALGDAYRATGNNGRAVESYRRSLGLNPRRTAAEQQAAAAAERALRELEGR